MYGFPSNLDYSTMVGEFTTQVCVGQFDLQFMLGNFRFIVQSPIRLIRDGNLIGGWDAASWPDPAFYGLMNVTVTGVDFPDNKTMRIVFESGLIAELTDNSDRHETMQIIVGKEPGAVHIV